MNGELTTTRELLETALSVDDMVSVYHDSVTFAGKPAREITSGNTTPVFVLDPSRVRANCERLSTAFADRWPGPVQGFYAMKANPDAAIIDAIVELGMGLECGGVLELAEAERRGVVAVANGSGKSAEVLSRIASMGAYLNVDSPHEVDWLEKNRPQIRAGIRLKPVPAAINEKDLRRPNGFNSNEDALAGKRWGLSSETASLLIERVKAIDEVDLMGFSMHNGRVSDDPVVYGEFARTFGETVQRLSAGLPGGRPRVLNVGGGWPAPRDPTFGRYLRSAPVEAFVSATCEGLLSRLGPGEPPELWFETGTYVATDAVALLATVVAIKVDGDQRWVHVDASSTGNLPRLEIASPPRHMLLATEGLNRTVRPTTVVGPLCLGAPLATDALLPDLDVGETIAIIDVGAYAPSMQVSFNGYNVARTIYL